MRLIDFIIFYTMAYFKRNKSGGDMWSNPLYRSVFLTSLILTLLSSILLEIICFIFFKLDALIVSATPIGLIIFCVIIGQLLSSLYVKRKRYEYIISSEYKPFTLSITLGMIICYLFFVFGFLGMGISEVIVSKILK